MRETNWREFNKRTIKSKSLHNTALHHSLTLEKNGIVTYEEALEIAVIQLIEQNETYQNMLTYAVQIQSREQMEMMSEKFPIRQIHTSKENRHENDKDTSWEE